MLPVPDRDAVIGVGGDEPGVSGVELDLHHLVARRPERPEAEHLAVATACGGGDVAGEGWVRERSRDPGEDQRRCAVLW